MVSTIYGFNMYIDTKDSMVSNYITNSGTWEPELISLIGRLVKEGDSILNLGSQSGLEALVMGKIVGPTGKIFIFEPYSFSNMLVTKNFEINGMAPYTKIYKAGASDKKTKALIKGTFLNTGGSRLFNPPGSTDPSLLQEAGAADVDELIDVEMVDNLLPGDTKIDFALLDVETMEIPALHGMRKLIERSPDMILMVEWQYAGSANHNRAKTLEFLEFMKQKGYRFYTYTGGNYQRCRLGSFYQYLDREGLL